MQRIQKGRSDKTVDKPPVLLQHGLFIDGVTWVLNSPDESLPFILVHNGFDVWLTNIRGTKYSREHRSLGPNDMAYWDWSWDELASYDLPASVQYVYSHTGQKMHYVGHSMGTLMVMAALSQNQLLNMLRSAALLSPIASMNHITSLPIKLAADLFLANGCCSQISGRHLPYTKHGLLTSIEYFNRSKLLRKFFNDRCLS